MPEGDFLAGELNDRRVAVVESALKGAKDQPKLLSIGSAQRSSMK
jgi:hypothetical protein